MVVKSTAEALVTAAVLGGDGGVALVSRHFGPYYPTIGYLTSSLLEVSLATEVIVLRS